LPLVLVILMYIGFFASSGVLGGQALAAWTGLPVTPSIIIVAIICTILAAYGYDFIHRYEGIVSVLFAIGFLYLTIRLFTQHSIGAVHSTSAFSLGTFLLVVSVVASWQLTYGPYVADYSRYLPSRTPIASSFWWTYAGSVISSIWMMGFGAIAFALVGQQFENDSVHFVVQQAGSALSGVFYILVILGIIAANVLNLYGVFLSSTTTIAALQRFRIGVRGRIGFVLGAAIVGTLVAVLGQGDFVNNYTNFLLLLLYFIIPWSAINLVDFYLIRHEEYDIDAIFDPNGIYGRVNWRTLVAYVVAILLELPFVNTTLYTGPLVSHLGGADIAWIVGLVVSTVVYYALMRARARAATPSETEISQSGEAS
jgi:NCS1 family nucleobase:cation symporter-1